MFANHPEMAKRWARRRPNIKDLVEQIARKQREEEEPGAQVA
jgi:hypothetical protein